jgi:hypothetical protein
VHNLVALHLDEYPLAFEAFLQNGGRNGQQSTGHAEAAAAGLETHHGKRPNLTKHAIHWSPNFMGDSCQELHTTGIASFAEESTLSALERKIRVEENIYQDS